LVQQRLLQRLQRGVLSFVEAGEVAGFFAEGVNYRDDGALLWNRRNMDHHFLGRSDVEVLLRRADDLAQNKLLSKAELKKAARKCGFTFLP
jgi:hypothetical protein